MTKLMDLVAGEASEILLALDVDDLAALDDRRRFPAHVALGGGLDPTWLDLFAEAARSRHRLRRAGRLHRCPDRAGGPPTGADRTVERVDPTWIGRGAHPRERDLSAIAGRWIDLVEDELGELPRDEKPWIRDLAGRLVAFCQAADRAPDVLFAWSLR